VDCGGPCPNACVSEPPVLNPSFSATINGNDWDARLASAIELNGRISISGISTLSYDINLVYNENFTTRTGNLDLTTTLRGPDISDTCFAQSGSVTFTKFDTTNKVVSGTFEFTCQGTDGVDVVVTNGKFEDIIYE